MAFLALFRLTDLPLFFPFFTKPNQELTQKLKIKLKKNKEIWIKLDLSEVSNKGFVPK